LLGQSPAGQLGADQTARLGHRGRAVKERPGGPTHSGRRGGGAAPSHAAGP
jgi:hypothetical protein